MPNPFNSQLRSVYDGDPWYGSSLMAVLRQVKPGQVGVSVNGGHTIGELVEHIIVWRVYVIEKLKGNQSYAVGDEVSWKPRAESVTESEWEDMLARLQSTQDELTELIGAFPEENLNDLVPTAKPNTAGFRYADLLRSGIEHDIYHIGQIALLKNIVD